nr:tetratricopeptide repeat protein [Anaerolineae bacterium]
MVLQHTLTDRLAVVPFLGFGQAEEEGWMGLLLSRLLSDHLQNAGFDVVAYTDLVDHLSSANYALPLRPEHADALRAHFKLRALIHGRFILDTGAGMFGFNLSVVAPDLPPVPLEATTPVAGFSRFMEQMALAVIERLGLPIDDQIRKDLRRTARPGQLEALWQLAKAHSAWQSGQNELAMASVISALAVDPGYEEAAELEVAVARNSGDSATARDAFNRWADIAEKAGRPLEQARRLIMMGNWLAGKGEWDNARQVFENARDLYQRASFEVGTARAENNIANLDMQTGNPQEAIRIYRRSLRIFESDPSTQMDAALTLLNLSQAHRMLGQGNETLRAVERATALARQLKDNLLQAHCLARIAGVYTDRGEWGSAEQGFAQAASLFDVLGDDQNLAVIHIQQGVLKRRQGKYHEAENLFLDALNMLKDSAAPHDLAILWLNLADLYLAMDIYDQALNYARQASKAFSHLKSGLLPRSAELLDIVEQLAREQPGSSILVDQAGMEDVYPGKRSSNRNSLYNRDNLYDNEHNDDIDRE